MNNSYVVKRVPRYTSYPTAPNFHKGIGVKQYINWINSFKKNDSLSLYFHIPYCEKLCWFCGCHMKVTNHYEPVSRYLKFLEQEVRLIATYIKDIQIGHIHFGGGSPSILTSEDFLYFMSLLRSQFSFQKNIEIAIEIDPRTVNALKIKTYEEVGVNRVSIGVQDFNLKVQKAINRVHSYETVNNVVNMLRAHNINAINMDLIYGLPFQSLDTIRNTIECTLSMSPDRIALFGYAHVPWIKKHQELITDASLPTTEERIAIFKYAENSLQEAGYVAIGIDHFAKSDDKLAKAIKDTDGLRRNFQGYTTDGADSLIGFGVSSISSFPQGYTQNTSNNAEYEQCMHDKKLAITKGIELTNQDIQRRSIIMSLMCQMKAKVDKEQYKDELEKLLPFIDSKDIYFEDDFLCVNQNARSKLRLIASVFDTYLKYTLLEMNAD